LPDRRLSFFVDPKTEFVPLGSHKTHHRSSEAGKRDKRNASRSPSPKRAGEELTKKPVEVADPGDFKNFPELSAATIKGLTARGINALFPVQYLTFRRILNREDLLIRDLTGSGKTLGFCLPIVEQCRKERLWG
jgi:ATP-dependent RNA helicase DDX21